MMEERSSEKICKIVCFDEDSVTDYVQIVAGGTLEKTSELLRESKAAIDAKADAKIGIGGVLGAILGMKASASAEIEADTNFSTGKMAKNIVKNTILSDFLEVIQNDKVGAIKCFSGYKITAPKDSLSYVALISPYLSMFKGGTGIPAGDMNIAVEKLDNTIKTAKGYYEFVGEKDRKRIIFRFNIKSFRNNYKAPDLMKMDISIYAVLVGKSTLSKLNFNNEFEIDEFAGKKDNPVYNGKLSEDKESIEDELLDVYDVLLAGVTIHG